MTTTDGSMRTADVLRALADQLDALGDVLNHPITVTVYDHGYQHNVTIQPFGDDDRRDVALTCALADALNAEINVRPLNETRVSVQFTTEFSGVELSMFAHVGQEAAERAYEGKDVEVLAVGDVLTGDDTEPPIGTVVMLMDGSDEKWQRLDEPGEWHWAPEHQAYRTGVWRWHRVTSDGPVTVIETPAESEAAR